MSAQDYDLYSSHETFPDMMATSHPYNYGGTYSAPMSTVEQQQSMHAFAYPYDMDQGNPPHLSASSESGASVQSTTSSSRGSPHMSADYREPWPQMHHGLGLAEGTMFKDFSQEAFVSSGVDFDPIISADKLPAGCVGESSSHVSSSEPTSMSPFPTLSSHVSFPSYSQGNAPKRIFFPEDGQDVGIRSGHGPSTDTNVFKSPTTPASATAFSAQSKKRRFSSAFVANDPQQRRESTASDVSLTSLSDAHSSHDQSPFPSSQFPYISSNSNSGDYVLPFESSYPSLTFQSPMPFAPQQFHALPAAASPRFALEPPPSPSPSNTSVPSQGRSDSKRLKSPRTHSPYLGTMSFQPYPQYHTSRRPSASSIHSHHSKTSRRSDSYEVDDDSREKGLCPIPECGRVFKDLKAHLLTHQNERPEKCPIQTCEYHIKGFARKYDKNRHTLTHYKGTMVCGFCPGSGSSAEKSFNRADVFKRHLTSVHGVEQTPPNSRRKSPQNKKATVGQQTAEGTCSTCDVTFANAQEFYEHLDDCVLRVVQQSDPAEDVNQKLLTSVAEDQEVKNTMERNGLPSTFDMSGPVDFQYDDDEEEEEVSDGDASYNPSRASSFRRTTGKSKQDVSKPSKQSRRGLTYSKGGVPLSGGGGGRKRRKHYPASWGCSIDRMRMKKRVLCVYDGPRRLWKDDMMLDREFEVRMRLPLEGKAYVTDLDVQTMKRAEAIHGATEEERGPWSPDNVVADFSTGDESFLGDQVPEVA